MAGNQLICAHLTNILIIRNGLLFEVIITAICAARVVGCVETSETPRTNTPKAPETLFIRTDIPEATWMSDVLAVNRGDKDTAYSRECFKGWFIELRIVNISREKGAGKGKTVLIYQKTEFILFYFMYSHPNGSIPLFCLNILCIGNTMPDIDLLDGVVGSEKVKEDVLIDAALGKI